MNIVKRVKNVILFSIIFICLVFLISVLTGVLINHFMALPIRTYNNQLSASDWIAFWGCYLGGVVGSVAALIALIETRHQSRLQHEENVNNRRLSVMPALSLVSRHSQRDIEVDSYFILDESNGENDPLFCEKSEAAFKQYVREKGKVDSVKAILIVTNYGLGPAFQVELSLNSETITLNGLKSGQSIQYSLIFFPAGPAESSFSFDISFTDILGTYYTQSQTMKYGDENIYFLVENPPKPKDKLINREL